MALLRWEIVRLCCSKCLFDKAEFTALSLSLSMVGCHNFCSQSVKRNKGIYIYNSKKGKQWHDTQVYMTYIVYIQWWPTIYMFILLLSTHFLKKVYRNNLKLLTVIITFPPKTNSFSNDAAFLVDFNRDIMLNGDI